MSFVFPRFFDVPRENCMLMPSSKTSQLCLSKLGHPRVTTYSIHLSSLCPQVTLETYAMLPLRVSLLFESLVVYLWVEWFCCSATLHFYVIVLLLFITHKLFAPTNSPSFADSSNDASLN